MDAISEVLDSLRLTKCCFSKATLRSPWGFEVPARTTAHFHYALKGDFFLTTATESHHLNSGDFVLIASGMAHALHDAPGSAISSFDALKPAAVASDAWDVRFGGSGRVAVLICGGIELGGRVAPPLIDLLPRVIVAPKPAQSGSSLRPTLELMGREAMARKAGGAAITNHLATVVVLQAIRGWLLTAAAAPGSWVKALTEPKLAMSISLMHRHPERRWTANKLAAEVGWSRSVFFDRFAKALGMPPNEYLTRLRMNIATTMLRDRSLGILDIAGRVGYSSEAAFSRAYKSIAGVPPSSVRRQSARGRKSS